MTQALQYDEAIAEEICERIACGESLNKLAGSEGFPAQSTVYKWLLRVPAFAEKYARAREAQMEAMAVEILEIADDTSGDTMTVKRGDYETEVANNEWINRSRLRVDTRKWLMSKLQPKKYGDKITQELTGEVSVKRVVSDI